MLYLADGHLKVAIDLDIWMFEHMLLQAWITRKKNQTTINAYLSKFVWYFLTK